MKLIMGGLDDDGERMALVDGWDLEPDVAVGAHSAPLAQDRMMKKKP